MSPETLLKLLQEHEALLEGHFLLSSGLHSAHYVQCARLLCHPDLAEKAAAALAMGVASKPEVVVSPALGGIILGHEMARALGVRALFCERENGSMTLRRGFSLAKGEKVLVVEDVITTGKSTREVCRAVERAGGHVVEIASLILRGEPDLNGAQVKALLKFPLSAEEPKVCGLCKQGMPIQKPGTRPAPLPNHDHRSS